MLQQKNYTWNTNAVAAADAFCAKFYGDASIKSSGASGGGNLFSCVGKPVGTNLYGPNSLCADGTNPDLGKPLAQQCTPPPPTCSISAGTVIPGDHYTVVSDTQLSPGLNFCTPATNCSLTASGRAGGKNLTTGKWEYQFMGPLTANGQVCTTNGTGASDPVKDAPIKCAAGMCTGTVNGVDICVKCVQVDNATVGKVTTTNPDGSKTETSTATSTTVNNNNVTTNIVTTTTTTPAGGGTPTTTTKTDANTESKDSFCAKNPNDPVCKQSLGMASGGDDCSAPPSCSGDAVQCMMVQQQWKSRCDMQKTDDATAYGVQLTTGQDPQASTLPTPSGATEVSMKDKYATVDNMGVVAKCIPDVDISLPGIVWIAPTHITISTAPLCDMGKLFGALNIIGTLALCAYMLKGAF
ncbi:virulence factor TspB C-terminal domain-related protein [Ensifer sp. 2YAB10]|uniref:virulence factor TspB C-terminal domain-related protein n=1 Tax=Ensifer sp. 2YAB10 TaxID=3233021 RepID=UPI003F92CE16